MNYFGHAAVASWSTADPGIVLGSMLPDFAGMCGGRIEGAEEAAVSQGIELHHTTDAAFHTLPAATGLMHELDNELAAGGCARGPRRAVAHIGMELLLDGALVTEPAYRAAYVGGLAHDAQLRWREAEAAAHYAVLIDRLRARGVPEDLREPAAITARLARVLGPRPRLAPSAEDLRTIQRALTAFQPRIEIAADTVIRALRAALAQAA